MLNTQFLKANQKSILGYSILGLVPLAFSAYLANEALEHHRMLQQLSDSGWQVLFLLSSLTMAVALTPSTFIALVSGFFLGWQAVAMMLPAYMLASLLGFFIGRWLDGGKMLESVRNSPKVHQALLNLNNSKWKLMFLVRLSPVLPFALMNLLMPAIRMPLKVFLVAGFVGMLPRTLLSIWVGNQAADLLDVLQGQGSSNELILVSLLTVVTVAGLVQIMIRAFRSTLS
ncbi:hypothetical protein EOPP23_13975 [Endozoicomonas sp. OPT23]|uniref:TVP38/TMEM64 family protein n=1 Tax=Endozoicomonas sp. OPT23 TaxID=2072845 RepID=UPI00129A7901|nr:VTT domain-containing protein [Endozoicomonas sp. OPT23]MRI34099.1 hypothetical protein [Endozoicomonas sp. OPT23]